MEEKLTLKSVLTNRTDQWRLSDKKPRIESYDIMRGVAVILMIMIHVVHVYAKGYNEDSVIGYLVEFLGGPPAAPAFMMLMGIFFIYANKGTLRSGILRGLNLLLLALALNLVRGVVPYYFLTELKGIPVQALGEYMRLEFLIFEVDILTFAGLAYMLMAVIYHFCKRPVLWLALALAVAVGSPLLWKIKGVQLPLQYFMNALWGDSYLVTFPVFPWLAFPLVGMVVGQWLRVSQNHSKVVNTLGVYAVVFIAMGLALIFVDEKYFYHNYNEMGVGAIIAIVGFVFFWQWAITKIYHWANGRIKTGFFMFLSQYVLEVYIIHWILCKWGTVLFGIDSLKTPGIALMFTAIIGLTMALTWLYAQLKKQQLHPKQQKPMATRDAS